jgi:dTDP-4-amino-4,6-dideoxygalactose transaminase
MKIPFYKPSIGTEEMEEVMATLKGGWLTTGPRTKQFEKDFGAYLFQKHAIALNSCTAALHLALEAIGIKAGQSVVVPTMTFAATAEVVRYLGARPLLVDCRSEDFNLDIADADRRIQNELASGGSVNAIMPVHYGGQVGDVVGVQQLARVFNLKVVEDAAHCCPAFYKPQSFAQPLTSKGPDSCDEWQSVGSSADISCYSFYANKTITTGEGGMACTQNDEFADRMRIMSLHGISKDAWKRFTAEGSWYYEIIAPGFKYNMTDIAASIGIHQLRKADKMHRRRSQLASLYGELLKDVEELILPCQQPDRIHSWHLYVIRLKLDRLRIDRAQFIAELQRRGIGVSVHWMPLHLHPYYRETYGYVPEDFPVANALYAQIITLPLYPDMSEEEVRYVADSIQEILAPNLKCDLSPVSSGD